MERIMNEENDWDHNVEGNEVEGPVVCVSRVGATDVSLDVIATSGGVGIQVMV